MAEVTRYPSSDAAVSGNWTLPGNVQADDGNLASITGATKNATIGIREQGNYGFDGVIPAGSTIDQVFIEVEQSVSTTGSVAHLENYARVSGADEETNTDSAEPTTLTARVYEITANRAWTRDDLLDANFKTRIQARQGNSATLVTYNWDYIRVRVVYTEAAGGGGAQVVSWIQDD